MPFQGQNTGSNPVGDATKLIADSTRLPALLVGGLAIICLTTAALSLVLSCDAAESRAYYRTLRRYPPGLNVIRNFSRERSTSNSG